MLSEAFYSFKLGDLFFFFFLVNGWRCRAYNQKWFFSQIVQRVGKILAHEMMTGTEDNHYSNITIGTTAVSNIF